MPTVKLYMRHNRKQNMGIKCEEKHLLAIEIDRIVRTPIRIDSGVVDGINSSSFVYSNNSTNKDKQARAIHNSNNKKPTIKRYVAQNNRSERTSYQLKAWTT